LSFYIALLHFYERINDDDDDDDECTKDLKKIKLLTFLQRHIANFEFQSGREITTTELRHAFVCFLF